MDTSFALLVIILGISVIASGLVFLKIKTPKYLKFIFPYLFLSFIVEIMAFIIGRRTGNNQQIYSLFTVVSFPLIFLTVRQILINSRIKVFILYATYVYIVLSTVLLIFKYRNKGFAAINYQMGAILVIAFVIYYFYELFRTPRYEKLILQPDFWIATAFLFFYGPTLPILAATNLIVDYPGKFLDAAEDVIYIANFTEYCLLTIASVLAMRQFKMNRL